MINELENNIDEIDYTTLTLPSDANLTQPISEEEANDEFV